MLSFAIWRLGERKIKHKKGLTQRRKDAKKGFKTKIFIKECFFMKDLFLDGQD